MPVKPLQLPTHDSKVKKIILIMNKSSIHDDALLLLHLPHLPLSLFHHSHLMGPIFGLQHLIECLYQLLMPLIFLVLITHNPTLHTN
jgi:hypothetical protein